LQEKAALSAAQKKEEKASVAQPGGEVLIRDPKLLITPESRNPKPETRKPKPKTCNQSATPKTPRIETKQLIHNH